MVVCLLWRVFLINFIFFLINQATEKNKPANFTGSNDLCAASSVSRVLS